MSKVMKKTVPNPGNTRQRITAAFADVSGERGSWPVEAPRRTSKFVHETRWRYDDALPDSCVTDCSKSIKSAVDLARLAHFASLEQITDLEIPRHSNGGRELWQKEVSHEDIPLSNLFVTLLKRLGVKTEKFADSTKALAEV
jgi:hypothetical protein